MEVQIGNRTIGADHPCLLVAELGINHGGSIDTALEMVRAAATAGADCIKVQAFTATSFCTEKATYQGERQIDLFSRYELSPGMLGAVADECRRRGLIFFGTPDSLEQARLLLTLGAPVIKVGSDDIVHIPLLRQLASLGKPMILSTGMASVTDIYRAIDELRDVPKILLHCVSQYPTAPERANIRRIPALRWLCPLVGYSDHTDGIDAAVGAVWSGACLVEKHFTLDRNAAGPDHAFSADPVQFAEMVCRIREVEVMRGDGLLEPSADELSMRILARRSIVAGQHIFSGDRLEAAALAYKRPGDGVPPWRADYIISKTATRDIAPDEQLREGDWL